MTDRMTPATTPIAGAKAVPLETSSDAFLGGRLTLRQPLDGYRAAIDPVLLAAAVMAAPGERILDLGCGIGTAGLCLLARLPGTHCCAIDVQQALVELAAANAAANGLGDRYQACCGSILDRAALQAVIKPGESVDQVIANPPYLAKDEATVSEHPIKALANVESDAMLADWVEVAARLVRPGGTVTFIHRADRLPDLIGEMRRHLGSLVILPIQPKSDAAATRVLVAGRKGKRAPARLLPALVLHDGAGGYTGAAEAILRGAAAITL